MQQTFLFKYIFSPDDYNQCFGCSERNLLLAKLPLRHNVFRDNHNKLLSQQWATIDRQNWRLQITRILSIVKTDDFKLPGYCRLLSAKSCLTYIMKPERPEPNWLQRDWYNVTESLAWIESSFQYHWTILNSNEICPTWSISCIVLWMCYGCQRHLWDHGVLLNVRKAEEVHKTRSLLPFKESFLITSTREIDPWK